MDPIKHILAATLTFALLGTVPTHAADHPRREVHINMERFAELPRQEQEEVLALQIRLEELIAVDRSTLGPEQRDALRSEWKQLRQEMRAHNDNGNVLYISTAGLIIIILLLIILL